MKALNQKNSKADSSSSMLESLKENVPPNSLKSHTPHKLETDTRATVASAEVELASLDAQILALQNRKAVLIQRHSLDRTALGKYAKLIPPICGVPLEILQEIALHCLPLQPTLTFRDAPLSLSHVSRAWRHAVLSLPGMWSELYLEVYNAEQRHDSLVPVILQWFGRAKSRPLSFHLFFVSAETDDDEDEFSLYSDEITGFVDSLVPTLKNARHLSLGARWVFDYMPVLSRLLSSLESLTLNNYSRTQRDGNSSIDAHGGLQLILGRAATHLRRLVLDKPFGFYQVNYPWSQLTSLSISDKMSVATWVRLLRECAQLRTGSFELSSTDYTDDDDSDFGSADWDTEDPVDSSDDDESDQETDPLPLMTTLEDLSLRISSSDITLGQCMASCRFANLKALQVDFAHSRTLGIGENTGSSVFWQLKNLEKLSLLTSGEETVARLEMLIRCAPGLTSLRLYLPQLDPTEIFVLLTHDDPLKPDLVPRLKALSIPFKFDPDEGDLEEILDAMALMLYCRTAPTLDPSEHLRRFTTAHRAEPNLNAQITDSLEPYAQNGLDFRVDKSLVHSVPTGDCMLVNWDFGIQHRILRREAARLPEEMVQISSEW
ncbi:hypothetical protein NLJ89_g10586 [Agrocybe chaxingu]|uniref:F-box domain-containing protein n=1 Tax=Agrocybe chaxingu TaxID=84603 RepID=A0A9W8MQS4_9AGAR|nr:hypothetical protein NLJ89_g10586 [Agrocybe chaxingu]